MDRRLELHELLVELMSGSDVHFQPPANVHLRYPCVVYKRVSTSTDFADNIPYRWQTRYQIEHISRRPDMTPGFIGLIQIPSCLHTRNFESDGLYHDIFDLYF